ERAGPALVPELGQLLSQRRQHVLGQVVGVLGGDGLTTQPVTDERPVAGHEALPRAGIADLRAQEQRLTGEFHGAVSPVSKSYKRDKRPPTSGAATLPAPRTFLFLVTSLLFVHFPPVRTTCLRMFLIIRESPAVQRSPAS